ncbi:LETM1 protein [Trifolium repens]|nr:LETM1 protein [Trifolium repens]
MVAKAILCISVEMFSVRMTLVKDFSVENYIEQSTPNVGVVDQESNEIHRFELLRSELMELEKRVQRSTYQSENNEDVWQGTQLLAIDVGAAMGLNFDRRGFGCSYRFLMLIPVTAVGHAAMLSAIQRYVPSLPPGIHDILLLSDLIPSTYAPERLDLLRQLEKVKQMTTNDVDLDEVVDEAK